MKRFTRIFATILSLSLVVCDVSCGSGDEEIEALQLEFATHKCYTVIDGEPSISNALDFNKYSYKYDYQRIHFPDEENDPKDLLGKLCENSEIKAKIEALNDNAELPSVSKDVIKLLNKILVSRFHDWKPFLAANIL